MYSFKFSFFIVSNKASFEEKKGVKILHIKGNPYEIGYQHGYLLANKIDEAEEIAKRYESFFGKGNFYLELQHHANIPDQKIAN